MHHKTVFTMQMDSATRARLDHLARKSHRSRAGVVRLLLQHAELREKVILSPPIVKDETGN